MAYKRILLKISGEALKGNTNEVLDSETLHKLASIIKQLVEEKIQVGIVCGGGNIFRGRTAQELHLERISADYMGMIATNFNAKMLENVLNVEGIPCKAFSMLPTKNTLDAFSKHKARNLLDRGYVCVFGGGTGKPLLSTDTAAALKAKEINAEVILVGKHKVEGILDADPAVNPNAKLLKNLSYDEIIEKDLKAMDLESIKICKENKMQVRVFNMDNLNNIVKAVHGEDLGTIIK